MRKENNLVILEPGDMLFRYGLGSGFPDHWDMSLHSIEYHDSILGDKNQIGALFFYDKEFTALEVLSAAIKKQKIKGNIIESATITMAIVEKEIRLLDLETNIDRCSQMLTRLYNFEVDVVNSDFFSHQKNATFDKIRDSFLKLYSQDWREIMPNASIVDDFFYNYPPLLGQTLTDFENGCIFKKIMQEQDFEGYVFMEQFSSNTYCLFSADNISSPIHRDVNIEDEIGRWLK